MKLDFTAIKVLNTSVSAPGFVSYDEPMIDTEALALFNSNGTYEDVFGYKKKEASLKKQSLSPISISCGKRTIYRQYAGRSIKIDTKSIGLSPLAWQQLLLDDAKDKTVVVEECGRLKFYWNHSNSATRVSCRLGVWGLILAFSGIVVSVVLQFI